MKTNTLTPEQLDAIDACWRAANYLSVGQIYPFDNPDLQVRVGNVVDLKKQLQAKRIGHKPYIDKNGPCLSDHFVEAEVKSFGYDALEDAVAWAGNGAHPSSASIPMRDSLPASGV